MSERETYLVAALVLSSAGGRTINGDGLPWQEGEDEGSDIEVVPALYPRSRPATPRGKSKIPSPSEIPSGPPSSISASSAQQRTAFLASITRCGTLRRSSRRCRLAAERALHADQQQALGSPSAQPRRRAEHACHQIHTTPDPRLSRSHNDWLSSRPGCDRRQRAIPAT